MCWEIICEIYNSFLKMSYEIYKLNWLIARPHLQNKTFEELESGGECYVCFDEFVDNEFTEYRDWYCNEVRKWAKGYGYDR